MYTGDEGNAGVDNTGYSEDGSTTYDSGGEPSTQLHNTHQAAAVITQSNTIHNQQANPYIRPDTYGQSESDLSLTKVLYPPKVTESDS